MRLSLLMIAVMMLAGCSATVVRQPQREPDRVGFVRYLDRGASPIINARREDAMKKMAETCHGDYRIDAEGGVDQVSGGEQGLVGSTSVLSSAFLPPLSDYRYMRFSCAPK